MRVAEVVFSDRVRLHIPFTSDQVNVPTQIASTPYFGSTTNIAGALTLAMDTIQADNTPNRERLIVLITDGEANVNEDKTSGVAAAARELATIVAIGITDAVNRAELLDIVGNQEPRVISVKSFEALDTVITQSTALLCTDARPAQDVTRKSHEWGKVPCNTLITLKGEDM